MTITSILIVLGASMTNSPRLNDGIFHYYSTERSKTKQLTVYNVGNKNKQSTVLIDNGVDNG